MPLKFGTGSIADAIRRALRITGPYDASIDETLVSTIVSKDLLVSPYRTTGKTFSRQHSSSASIGNLSTLALVNPLTNPIIVRRLNGFVSAAVDVFIGYLTPRPATPAFAVGTDVPLVTGERISPPVGAIPVVVGAPFWTPSNPAVVPTTIQLWAATFLARGNWDTGDRDWTLAPGCQLIVTTSGTLNVGLAASADISIYDDVPNLGEP